jgi:hypothetical protein
MFQRRGKEQRGHSYRYSKNGAPLVTDLESALDHFAGRAPQAARQTACEDRCGVDCLRALLRELFLEGAPRALKHSKDNGKRRELAEDGGERHVSGSEIEITVGSG